MTPAELTHLDRILPRGRKSACSVADLADAMCAAGMYVSDRAVREGLEQLLSERRVPVCTLPVAKGVFVAVTPEEMDAADAHLRSKAMALLHRRRSLRLCRERLSWSPTLFDMEARP